MKESSSARQKVKHSIECWIFSRFQDCFLLLQCPETENHREYWQPVTGGIERNESKHSACVREVLEETGLKIDKNEIIKLIDNFKVYGDTIELHKTVFVAILDNATVKISDEHIGFKWEAPEMVDQMLLWGSNKTTFEMVLSYLKLDK